MCPGSEYERMAHFQNWCDAGLSSCSVPSTNPIYNSLAPPLSLSFRCINGRRSQEHWQPIWGGCKGVGAYFATSQVKKRRGLWGATAEVWTHLPLIILPVRGFSLDLWTSELPHTTNLLINREIPWKNFEQPLCVRVCTKVCKGKRQHGQQRERVNRGNALWHVVTPRRADTSSRCSAAAWVGT